MIDALLLRRTSRYFTIARIPHFRPNEHSPMQEENTKLQAKQTIADMDKLVTLSRFVYTIYMYDMYSRIVYFLFFLFYLKNILSHEYFNGK